MKSRLNQAFDIVFPGYIQESQAIFEVQVVEFPFGRFEFLPGKLNAERIDPLRFQFPEARLVRSISPEPEGKKKLSEFCFRGIRELVLSEGSTKNKSAKE